MESPRRTLLAVHAHPDDECVTTGGVLARYSAEGVRTLRDDLHRLMAFGDFNRVIALEEHLALDRSAG